MTLGRQLAGDQATLLQTLAACPLSAISPSLPPDAYADSGGSITAGDRLKELLRQQKAISEMSQFAHPTSPALAAPTQLLSMTGSNPR